MKKINQESTRQHNSRLVLNTIYQQGQISRVDISRSTRLTRTTVSEIVSVYIEDGLVVEAGLSQSTGGKPATLLEVDPNARVMVGVDLAEQVFRGALVNMRGEILGRSQIPIGEQDGEVSLQLVYALIEKLLEAAEVPVIGIGIGTPGLMDPVSGVVRQAINLNWVDLPLGNFMAERFHLPVQIANDCQVAALGEFTFGDVDADHLILIKAGRGIGAGIVLGGKIFFGDQAGAGEIGHIQVVQNGETCRCGNRGCLETIVSDRALVKQARRFLPDHPDSILNHMASQPSEITMDTLIAAHRNGDPFTSRLVSAAAQKLGSVVAHLVGALNVNHILIAGSLSRFDECLLGPIRQQVQNGTLPGTARQTNLKIASLGEDIVILGAASLILKNELGLF